MPGLKEINYDFKVAKPTTLTATVSDNVSTGTLTLYRNGISLLNGSSVSKSLLASGSYSLSYSGTGKNAIVVSTSTVAAPTRLEAEALDGNTIGLNWDDNSDNEMQYRVDRWTRFGWRRGVRTGADSTAVLIKNLVPDTAVTYRISAVTSDGLSARSTNIIRTQSLAVDTSGWYRVKLTSGMTKGEAGWSKEADTIDIWPGQEGANGWSKWVFAGSWQTAAYTVLGSVGGPVQVKKSDNTIVSHSFPSGGDFKVGLEKDIKASSEGSDALSASSEAKMIALEDSYGGIDRDYDDFTWGLSVDSITNLEFGKSYSGQLQGDHNYTGRSGGVDSFILMGTKDGDNVATRHQLALTLSSPDVRDQLKFAYVNEYARDFPQNGQMIMSYDVVNSTWSGQRVSLLGTLPNPTVPSGEYAKPISVIAGFDNNLDGKLQQAEIAITNHTTFKVVTSQSYDQAKAYLSGISTIGGLVYPISAEWLHSFSADTDFPGSVSSNATVEAIEGLGFDHFVGADFDKSPNVRKHRFSTVTGSSLPNKLLQSTAFLNALKDTIEVNKAALVSAARSLPYEVPEIGASSHETDWLGPFTLVNANGDELKEIQFGTGDLYWSLKNTRIQGAKKVWFKAHRYTIAYGNVTDILSVSEAKVDTTVTDLYDFRYGGGDNPATAAAAVQAGHSTLGNAGRVRLVDIAISDARKLDEVLESREIEI